MKDGDSEVTIAKPDGEEMDNDEARKFLEQLQKGVMYLPQGG